MPIEFRVTCKLNWTREDFWKVRAHPEFLKFLIEDKTLHRIDASKKWQTEDGMFHRRQSYVPRAEDFSELIMKFIGDSLFVIHDYLTWEERPGIFSQSFDITPTILTDSVKTKGTLQLESIEDDSSSCLHVLQGQIAVNIFGVGYLFEQTIKANMDFFYTLYPASVARFKEYVIKFEKGLLDKEETTNDNLEAEEVNDAVKDEEGEAQIEQENITDVSEEQAEARKESEKPDPLVVSDEEFSKLLDAFLEHHSYDDIRSGDPKDTPPEEENAPTTEDPVEESNNQTE